MGGRNENGALTSSEALDPSNRKWTALEPSAAYGATASGSETVPPEEPYFDARLDTARNSGGAAVLGGAGGGLYVAGGVVCRGEEFPSGCGKTRTIVRFNGRGWDAVGKGMTVARSSFAFVAVPQDYFQQC